jgi:hypothetical protein
MQRIVERDPVSVFRQCCESFPELLTVAKDKVWFDFAAVSRIVTKLPLLIDHRCCYVYVGCVYYFVSLRNGRAKGIESSWLEHVFQYGISGSL